MAAYGYKYKNGGLVGYEGVQINLKEITDITADWSINDTHLSVTVNYEDKKVEKLETDIADTASGGVKLTGTKEYWNNRLVFGEEENNVSG